MPLNTGGSVHPTSAVDSRSGTIGRPPCERGNASIVYALHDGGARMEDRWTEAGARAAADRWGGDGEALALRVYSSRLIGSDPDLVLHGGGNTSVRARALDLFGEEIPVLHIKGSGWDLAGIEPAGLPAVAMTGLARRLDLEQLID